MVATVLDSEVVNGQWWIKLLFDNKVYFVPAVALGIFVQEGMLKIQ